MKKEKKSNRRSLFLKLIVPGLVLFLAVVQLFFTHHLALSGEEMKEMESMMSKLEEENRLLEEEISQIGSMSVISQRASQLGLVHDVQVLHLSPGVPVAFYEGR